MSKYGFEIKKLVLRRIGKKDAILVFDLGLNVVAGASDTGKSFAFECINYILGASDIPDKPNEAIGYDSVLLELTEKQSQNTVTLKRSLLESEKNEIFYIYSDIAGIDGADFKTYSSDSKAKNSLSAKLLETCHCSYKYVLKKSTNGETEAFTYRKFAYLTMLNETRIVQKNSPIFISDTRRDKNSTKEVATFFTLISGVDYDKYIKTESVDIKKAQLKGAINELMRICDTLRLDITKMEEELQGYNLSNTNEKIKELETVVKEQKLAIEQLEEERNHSSDKYDALVKEKARVADNLSKFLLLKKNYQSDIDRLEFIELSHDYTGQLQTVKCPICNGTMSNDENNVDKEIYFIAIDKEKLKLKAHLLDLQGTIEDFQNDILLIGEKIEGEKHNIDHINNLFEKQGKLISQTLKECENYLAIRDKLSELERSNKKVFDINARISELNERIDNAKSEGSKVDIKKLTDELMIEFCKLVQDLLEEWGFLIKDGITKLGFDNKVNDVIISGKTKASFGKGARSIINAAFIISIMKYCMTRGLSHPGFVILDSPLTTYKDKDKKKNEKNEEVNKSVKDSFYMDLAKISKDCQIIIFDNEVPPSDLSGITYHHFTGNPEIERTGFIPN